MAFTNDLDLSAATQPLTKPATINVPAAAASSSVPPAMTSAILSIPMETKGKLQQKTHTVVYIR
jgi:hypothetical protein